MGKHVRRVWHPTAAGLGVPRRDRQAGAYAAYIPDTLSNRSFMLGGDVAADVADAERAVVKLDADVVALTDTEGLARLLLRAESVASSHIEGLEVSAQRLLRTSLDLVEQRPASDVRAVEILANVEAIAYAVESTGPITVERLIEVHRRLLAPTRDARIAGVLRTEQNWIGGTSDSPLRAAFVPPPPEDVERLLADLCAFCENDGLPAIAQAAIAHAQFETIHPFADGNGRTGRALIAMVLRRRGLTRSITPPVSLILATRSNDYVAHLEATRHDGSPASPAARSALGAWIAFFASACSRAVDDAERFEARVRALRAEWRTTLAGYRSDSTVHAVAALLPAMPVISVRAAEKATGRSFKAANDAVAVLLDAGILVPSSAGRRNRTFEARSLIDAFTSLERRLASPAGDTRVSKPARPVPHRPRR